MNVYLDNAASTKIDDNVISYMNIVNDIYANPACQHEMAEQASEIIENSRRIIADKINAKPNEIIFTSSGTESNNLAIQGYYDPTRPHGNHIITTAIEHVSVLETIHYLELNGYRVTYLSVDKNGMINLNELRFNICNKTILISVIYANNEIGTIQNISEIGKIAREYGICFHTDGVQAFGHCDIDVQRQNIDMMSISGHKFHAPKGIGALYMRNDIELKPLLFGGKQEYGLRSGTENTIGITAMGKAVEIMTDNTEQLQNLRNRLKQSIFDKINGVKFNDSEQSGLPNILNLSINGVDGLGLTKLLSSRGIYISNGAACSSGDLQGSHVLRAIGLNEQMAQNAVRFSLSKYNTAEEIDYVLDVLPELVASMRNSLKF